MVSTQSNRPTAAPPLVSFIVTCYDLDVDLIRQCLDSILSLSLSKLEREIIVVDDGSAVSPMNELADYGDDILYLRRPNGGLSVARNTGLRVATGQYVQFVDGDDKLSPSVYDHCLDTVRFGKADMVMFSMADKADGNGACLPVTGPVDGGELLRHSNIRAAACGYVFRRESLGSLRFTPGIYHEDEEFTPQLLLRCEHVYVTDAKAYIYRRREGSITQSADRRDVVKRLGDSLDVILRLRDMAYEVPRNDSMGLQRRVAQLTMGYIYNAIMDTRSLSFVEKRVERLRQLGLFPLPDRDYTAKYKWFRRMSSTRMGLALLVRVLPLMPRER